MCSLVNQATVLGEGAADRLQSLRGMCCHHGNSLSPWSYMSHIRGSGSQCEITERSRDSLFGSERVHEQTLWVFEPLCGHGAVWVYSLTVSDLCLLLWAAGTLMDCRAPEDKQWWGTRRFTTPNTSVTPRVLTCKLLLIKPPNVQIDAPSRSHWSPLLQ